MLNAVASLEDDKMAFAGGEAVKNAGLDLPAVSVSSPSSSTDAL